ncbi:MAG TPA: M20 family metallopeptidase [Gemmataceae bacterium]|nr:M20 family metallopeptidase [Gemmataceae bacterium]
MRDSHRLLQDLVRIPSVNPMGRAVAGEQFYEVRVTDYLERFFRDLGVRHERQSVAPLRDNIIARYESPGAAKTILLEVHQDTVPVDGMTIEPFAAEVRDGKLYGRGSCDVKGGMAAMLTAFARLVRERPAEAANVILACTVDEEHTFYGVQQLMAAGLRANFAVVAEPTSLQIVDAHKGVVRWKVRTEGRACHSSTPEQGLNAVYRMGHVLPLIELYANRLQQSSSHPRLGPPTLSVGRIEGGVSVNTVPDHCVIEIDRRLLPGESPEAAWRDFRDHLATAPVPAVCDPIWLACPALNSDGADEVQRRLGAAIDAVEGRHAVRAVPFGTDASSVAEAGVPAVVFGPGDIAQAHTKDEWIELDQIDRAAEILYRFCRDR